MKLNTIKNVKKLQGKKVLLRVDFNVPIGKDNRVDSKEDWRIVKSLPTIKHLLSKKAKIVIICHLGRPGGKRVNKLSLKPVAKRLSFLIKKQVSFCNTWDHKKILQEVDKLKNRQILMLENVRFNPGEEQGSTVFAKKLADFTEIYVNDAFANSHRKQVSMLAVTKYLPSYAGLLMEEEVNRLEKLIKKPAKPFIGIMGGVKIETKIPAIIKLIGKVEYLLLGGVIANTILRANGFPVGVSLFEEDMVRLVKKSNLDERKLRLPIDLMVCNKKGRHSQCRVAAAENVKSNEVILDIGPGTRHLYTSIISQAKTIFWNGPMGLIEEESFCKGTKDILTAVIKSKADVVIGGGDIVGALMRFNPNVFKKENIFISTGGGALLKFMEEGNLPALKPLVKK